VYNNGLSNVVLGRRYGYTALGMVYGQDLFWKAADVEKIVYTDHTHTAVRIHFSQVCDRLFFLGTGPIKGFAVTLSLGIVISMFTAIVVTRVLLTMLVDKDQNKYARFFGVVRG
jgi:hypothetical protein